MLSEADMTRIIAEKYRLAELVYEEFIDNEALAVNESSEKIMLRHG